MVLDAVLNCGGAATDLSRVSKEPERESGVHEFVTAQPSWSSSSIDDLLLLIERVSYVPAPQRQFAGKAAAMPLTKIADSFLR